MLQPTPIQRADTGLPNLKDIHVEAIRLRHLILALENLIELGGPESGPIWAIVDCAVPLARKVCNDIERVM